MQQRGVVITGIGLLTSLGVGLEAHTALINGVAEPVLDTHSYAPYMVHPLPDVDWALQIPKRSDQRQMEPWQRIGTFAAGLALDDAGLNEDQNAKAQMDMIVAAAGGERAVDVDEQVLALAENNERDAEINRILTTELRPTLFLAQLSNLLAGNISIVHKVTGSSRTFMGEEGAGLSALSESAARIRAGQSRYGLVGASYNAEHPDMLFGYEVRHLLARGSWGPVLERTALGGKDAGIIPGSGGVFLVLEEEESARHRGANVYARIDAIALDQGSDRDTRARLDNLAQAIALDKTDAVLSTASGAPNRTAVEHDFLEATGKPFSVCTSQIGSLREGQSLAGTALAALALNAGKGTLFDYDGTPHSVAVSTIGMIRAEGMIRLSATDRAGGHS